MNIFEMAQKAGWNDGGDCIDIKAFAALVEAAARADEREECANMCMAVPRTGAYFARLIRARGTT